MLIEQRMHVCHLIIYLKFQRNLAETKSSSRRDASGEIGRFHALFTGEKKEKRKDYLAGRDLTKICYNDEQFKRWRQLKNDLDFNTDRVLPALRLDNFSNTKHVSTTVCLKLLLCI